MVGRAIRQWSGREILHTSDLVHDVRNAADDIHESVENARALMPSAVHLTGMPPGFQRDGARLRKYLEALDDSLSAASDVAREMSTEAHTLWEDLQSAAEEEED